MPTASLKEFITKKEACEQYGRSHRSLTRDLSAAIRTGDRNVLPHIKLRTDNGEIHDGADVSLELIQKLSNQGLSPTWYLNKTWVEATYGTRSGKNSRPAPEPTKDDAADRGAVDSAGDGSRVVSLLKERVTELERDKQELREELKIKNDQIKEVNERGREMNLLTRDLHELMKDMQQRLLPPPQASLAPVTRDSEIDADESVPPAAATEATVVAPDSKPTPPKKKPGSPQERTGAPKSKKTPPRKRQASPSKKKTKNKTTKSTLEGRFATATPTFHRLAKRWFHR